MKIYKNKHPNIRKISLLFATQVLLGTLPVALFAIYVIYVQRLEALEEYNLSFGIAFLGIMVLSLIGYSVASKRYNVLISGYRGEKILVKTAKRLKGDYTIFVNLPVRYKKNRSEIDLLLIGKKGLLFIEVKNHSGVIIGTEGCALWTQRKYYRKGKVTETPMENPLRQIKRQREILKSILRANGHDVWIDSILFFSGNPGLKLNVTGNIAIASNENELTDLINDYHTETPLDSRKIDEISKVLRSCGKIN